MHLVMRINDAVLGSQPSQVIHQRLASHLPPYLPLESEPRAWLPLAHQLSPFPRLLGLYPSLQLMRSGYHFVVDTKFT